jgi:16S rRNA processing protein RimM
MPDKIEILSGTWVMLGMIGAPHGVKGAVHVFTELQQPSDLRSYSPLTLKDGRELKILSVKPGASKKVIVSFEGITTRDQAQALNHESLHILRDRLPKLKGEDFYHADLIGLDASTVRGENLGKVIAVHNFGAGDILEIKTDNDTLMVAFTKSFVPQINLDKNVLTISDSALENV